MLPFRHNGDHFTCAAETCLYSCGQSCSGKYVVAGGVIYCVFRTVEERGGEKVTSFPSYAGLGNQNSLLCKVHYTSRCSLSYRTAPDAVRHMGMVNSFSGSRRLTIARFHRVYLLRLSIVWYFVQLSSFVIMECSEPVKEFTKSSSPPRVTAAL